MVMWRDFRETGSKGKLRRHEVIRLLTAWIGVRKNFSWPYSETATSRISLQIGFQFFRTKRNQVKGQLVGTLPSEIWMKILEMGMCDSRTAINKYSCIAVALLLVREKDVCWEYCEKLDGNKVKCKFCLKVLNGGISRLKHHLSRLPSKGVLPCSKVRDDVTDRVRTIIASKEDGKEAATAKKQRLAEMKPLLNMPTNKALICMEPSPLAKAFPSGMQVGTSSSYEGEDAEKSIALFFFKNKLDFCIARSSSYQLMIDTVAKCGSGFRVPSSEALKTTWLERIKSEVSEHSKEIEKDWEITGCTIIADTWTDNKSRALINFLVSSPSGTFFHKSVDASTYFKNTKCLADLFDSVIQDFGAENVVQVIMDSALNYIGVGSYIMQNYSTIFCTPCASHCLNSILEDFCKIDWVNRCILQAQSISKFIYNDTWVLDLMRKFTGVESPGRVLH
ncbi:hypothetical protein IFM89_017045 [Coptis chinensis]|uniref:BED-type domain-containing protein n=1 Tax=Coptis chinensis TaxID=261450 RepID=A0A835HKR0_9MAGN|nr:hypothetical protein IFM89_017045 [Coptis chinensis]